MSVWINRKFFAIYLYHFSACFLNAGEVDSNVLRDVSPFSFITQLEENIKVISNDVNTKHVERTPAVISAESIMRVGEAAPESYSSFDVAGLGNTGKVFEALKPLESFGRLPIPVTAVRSKGTSGASVKERESEQGVSSYNTSVGQTSFGTNPSDSSFQNLNAIPNESSDSNESVVAAPEETTELIVKIRSIKTLEMPYAMEDYRTIRDLFKNANRAILRLVKEDDLFKEKAAAIFSTFQQRDNNQIAKKAYRDFYDGFQEEKGKGSKKQTAPSSRVHLETTH